MDSMTSGASFMDLQNLIRLWIESVIWMPMDATEMALAAALNGSIEIGTGTV